ncbi:uncharacterized protein [Amphiura filiformis]|uniref:uncharacterized protein isoform X2 n=1 Tax=Amphiura filiformis TaxID=82378 RepID=UPI003B22143C
MAAKLLSRKDMAEVQRLKDADERKSGANWKRWGPYLSERQWGTVREDYSPNGECWDYFPHDHARKRAYRWGEDGLLGITDRECRLCFCLALWNGKDSILKERLFGLTGPQGNHGEDCKENYYYLDSSPTHSYMKALYKYPQSEYPYAKLEQEARDRSVTDPEFELEDSGAFNEKRYWDVFAEYAKNTPNDILCRITVANRGPDTATIHVLPQLFYRNTWIWGCDHEGCTLKPKMSLGKDGKVACSHESLGKFTLVVDDAPDGTRPNILFTENETNMEELYKVEHYTKFARDGFHRYVVKGEKEAVDSRGRGTKCAPHYTVEVPSREQVTLRVRFYANEEDPKAPYFGEGFDKIFEDRIQETNVFYNEIIPAEKETKEYEMSRQAYASLLWTKQFYHYIVRNWLFGDKDTPTPPESRLSGRNADWKHLFNRDVVSMPDKWEYPWYASWDLAFHMIPFARVDPFFAKEQLLLFLREWYMAPNGQMPAYEFAFDDVNPPVHAWAVFRVFKMTGKRGERDRVFLAKCFHKLLLNFTWWVNRKDPEGRNIFSGGFLGLDNIGVFDRSRPLPTGGHLEQADGTAWVAFFCIVMLDIALELAITDPAYEDMASKFFEHFVAILDAMNAMAGGGGLWDEKEGFYYDVLRVEHCTQPLRIRSLVGLVPLFATLTIEEEWIDKLPGFKKRLEWFMKHRPELSQHLNFMTVLDGPNAGKGRQLLGIPSRKNLKKVLEYMLDEKEFLSDFGIRSLSKVHKDNPFRFHADNTEYRVDYVPAESNTEMFGGNSNWRGPIWLCMNYLLVESLERYDYFYGDTFKVECPTGSGNMMRLKNVAKEICQRMVNLFLPDENGRRPCHGDNKMYTEDADWKDLILFYEFFHGDNGRGCGASHQTGWTAVITACLEKTMKS